MTPLHKAAQMALDALDAITDDVDGTGLNTMPSFDKALDAIATLREALNAPEPEPVAEVFDTFGNSQDPNKAVGHVWLKAHYFPPKGAKLYAAPPAAPEPSVDDMPGMWEPSDTFGGEADSAAPVPDGMETNADEVICPNCAHQFRAIPENVQSLLLASGHEPPFTASPAAPAAPVVPNGCEKIFTHKWLDPNCIEQGCKSLAAPVVPLTDEQIDAIRANCWSHPGLGASFCYDKFARAIEAAHGITGASK